MHVLSLQLSRIRWFWWVTFLSLAPGCASYTDQMAKVSDHYASRDYAGAIKELDASEVSKQDRNRLLLALEKGMILDRQGNLAEARKLWLQADQIADELYTVSVSKVAASFIYNDSITDYAGEDYEVVHLHTLLALNFIEEGKYAEARIQAMKINNKLSEINSRYEEGKNKYARDAFALYLSGVIFEKQEEWDSAIIDYRKSLSAYEEEYRSFNKGGVPESLVRALGRMYKLRNRKQELQSLQKEYSKTLAFLSDESSEEARELAQIVVFHELGQISKKTTMEFVLPVAGQIVRFSFPIIRNRSYSIYGKTGFDWRSGSQSKGFADSENLVDFNAIAYQSLEDRRVRFTIKAAARLLAKGQLTYQAEKNFGILGKVAGMAYSTITETADTRGWSLMPGAISVSRHWVEPGEYKLEIRSEGRSNLKTVNVKAGELVVLRDKT